MAICASKCSERPPKPLAGGCNPSQRPGGISYIIFADCSLVFNDINDPAEWCKYVTEGRIVSTLKVMGDKPKGSATKKKTNSCEPETVTGYENTLNFKDYNADDVDFTDIDFYNTLKTRSSKFQFGFMSCDGLFYGFINSFSIDIDQVIEDDSKGSSYIDGIISWNSFTMLKPTLVYGLQGILTGNCNNVPNFIPCATPAVETPNGVNICTEGTVYLEATYFYDATYQWLSGVTPIPGETSNIFFPTEAGTYSVTIIRPDCANVTTTGIVVTSSQPEFDTIAVAGIAPTDVTITPLGLVTDFLYQIIVNGIPTPFTTNNVFGNVVAGVHTAVIKEISTGCTKSQTFVVASV